MTDILNVQDGISEDDVQRIADAVRAGELVVIPTDTSYAVICDAFNATAVTSLRMAKGQVANTALPIAAGSIDTINGVARLSTLATDLVNIFWPGPLTVLTAAQESLSWNIGSRDHALAVRVPQHEIALKVLAAIGPVVMTGAQLAEAKPVVTVEDAQAALGDAVSHYLDAGSLSGTISSVVDASSDSLRLLREGELSLAQLREVIPMIVKATA